MSQVLTRKYRASYSFRITLPTGKRAFLTHALLLGMLLGTSLVVQWLGFHAFTAGDTGSIPGQAAKILQATQPKKSTNFKNSPMVEGNNFFKKPKPLINMKLKK